MLAYRVSYENVSLIAALGGSVVVTPEDKTERYFVTKGLSLTNTVITKEEFERDYIVKTRINEALGRFIVEKK